jgi:hypothetical protein
MFSLSRLLLLAAALAAAALAPAAADAAEGFSAVTSDGRLAFIHSDSAAGTRNHPKAIGGLGSGERVVGLDLAPSGKLLALTSAGRIASIDRATAKTTPQFARPVTAPIDPDAPLTFAVAPDGAGARIITTGRDVVVDLSTGAATAAPGPSDAPALDYGADGRLIGFDSAQNAVVAQAAPGPTTLSTLLALPFKALEPTRATVGSDGSVYAVSRLSANPRLPAQSRFVRYDPASGRLTGANGVFLHTEIVAIAATGRVPDDTVKPVAGLHGRVLHRHVTRGYSYYSGLRIHVDEGGQTVASLRLGGKVVGFALGTRFDEGSIAPQIVSRRGEGAALRRAAREGRSVVVHLTVHDWAGNTSSYDRAMRLAR